MTGTETDGKFQGNVSFYVDQDLSAGEVGVDAVRMGGAEEVYYADTIGLALRAGRTVDMRGRLTIPTGLELPEVDER